MTEIKTGKWKRFLVSNEKRFDYFRKPLRVATEPFMVKFSHLSLHSKKLLTLFSLQNLDKLQLVLQPTPSSRFSSR